ncbi:tyrosine protein phosphatase [Neobacillus notoginsengisoli]|uniref:Tyrosine-protein phosphatase n=1 Tax=Neobacillus notoginsengisoli TaxID=1578198 RepID=A0A417YGZ4_9BACI|nr:CpsB/CapC family capsule biosynthesis tyrosine phosphatase [Neobacillus notoginsengisoli]RHW32119.1 tyrosine protein phosphatase [Neobacillus notoginsengisoli]
MVDIHCHILPGADDGAKNLQDSIMMAKVAMEQGITKVIATPHHLNSFDINPKETIIEKVHLLNRKLKEEKVDLEILPGQEVRIYGELLDGVAEGEIQTLAGSDYLLIELPASHVPRYTEKLFFDLQLKGYIPVIAHPERNQEIIERPEVLYQLIKKGALSQITAASAAGEFGKKIQKFSIQLLESNLTHFLASDAHNVTNRGFKMEKAYNTIHSAFGSDMVFLLKENAELLIEGKHAHREIPARIKKKKFLGLF